MKQLLLASVISSIVFAPIVTAQEEYPEVEKHIVMFDTDTTFNYDFDGVIIINGSEEDVDEALDELASFLINNPNRSIRVEGFADETGTMVYNLGLSARRIRSVTGYLLNQGVKRSQILSVPYGELNELSDGHSDQAWADNRRIRVRVISL